MHTRERMYGNHQGNLKATEQATVALVQDLKRLGMLDSTLGHLGW